MNKNVCTTSIKIRFKPAKSSKKTLSDIIGDLLLICITLITKAPPFLRPYQPRPKSHVISSQCFTVLHVYAMFLRNKSKHCITNYNQRGSCDRYFSQFQLFKIWSECVILDSLNIRYWRGARRVVDDGSEIWAVKVNPSTPPVASDQFLVIYFCTLYTVRI